VGANPQNLYNATPLKGNEMEFKYIGELQDSAKEGAKASIRGWVYRKRDLKKRIFLVIRDSSGIMQAMFDPADKGLFKKAQKVTRESSVKLTGKLRKDERAPGGFELVPKTFEIVGLADTFPISRDKSTEFLLDVRHLWIRSRELTAVMKIRSKVFEAIHEFSHSEGFYETHVPILTPTACESGGDQMKVDYFGQDVFLTQSWQLYAEAMIHAIEKLYTITPAFRSEKSKTSRHLIEYWTAEMEAAWVELDGMIELACGMIEAVCQKVGKECKKELEVLGRDPKDLLKIKRPFPKITYAEALKILKKDGVKFEWGEDLRTKEEEALGKHYAKPIVVTEFPTDIMAFYKPPTEKDPKVAKCFDIICPDVGMEIVGGSERCLDAKFMKDKLKKAGEDVKNYDWYFDTRKYGSVPHSGFGLGIERVIQWICGLEHIRDAIPFPRTLNRFSP